MTSDPGDLMKLDIAGPTWFRQPVQFKNWDNPGLAIAGGTLVLDAKMFREIAAQLRTITGDNWARIHACALETLAGQYERTAQSGSKI